MADVQAAADGRRRGVDRVDVLARLGAVEGVGVVGLPALAPRGLETLERRLVRYDDRRRSAMVVSGAWLCVSVMAEILGRARSRRRNRLRGRAPGRPPCGVRRSSLEFVDDPAPSSTPPRRTSRADPVAQHGDRLGDQADRGCGRRRGARAVTIPRWWLLVRDEAGAVVGRRDADGAVRAAPALRAADARRGRAALARALHERGERSAGSTARCRRRGSLADELARLDAAARCASTSTCGSSSSASWCVPPAPAGRLRRPTADDADLALAWFLAFETAAAEQAGRDRARTDARGVHARRHAGRGSTTASIWFWEDEAGERVHLTGANPPAYGVARVGPVYTPREHRGHGYASAAVAEVSRHFLDAGRAGLPLHRPGQPDVQPASTRRSATGRWSTW